jgi:hypothetical protein
MRTIWVRYGKLNELKGKRNINKEFRGRKG